MQGDLYIRIKQALTWLKRNQGILQKDIADKMGMAEASFTRALARVKEKNDEDFVISFHSVVSEFISLDYLLTGNGDMLANKEKESLSVFQTGTEKLIVSLEERIKDLNNQLEDKEKIIKLLEQKIEYLEAMEHIDSDDIVRKHPFPVGAAEDMKIQPNI